MAVSSCYFSQSSQAPDDADAIVQLLHILPDFQALLIERPRLPGAVAHPPCSPPAGPAPRILLARVGEVGHWIRHTE